MLRRVRIAAAAHPSALRTASLLAFAGGFLDGFTYVGHGHVFANAMTGNVVLLGISLMAEKPAWQEGLRHLPPIFMFFLGVMVAKALEIPKGWSNWYAHLAALLIQICTLSLLAMAPASTPDAWFTTTIAFAASIQVESFRKVNGRSYNSTFTTGNLRTLAEHTFAWLVHGHSALDYEGTRDFAVICGTFFIGAGTGAFSTLRMSNKALFVPVVVLLIVLAVIGARVREQSELET